MTSARDIYTWIIDYACKFRLDDIICEMYGGMGQGQFAIADISPINLKISFIWLTVRSDEREGYSEAVSTLDALCDEAVKSKALELFVRLGLGLRLKDLVYSLSLPESVFKERLDRYFPEGKLHFKSDYLLQIFSREERQEILDTVKDVCHYFHALASSKAEKQDLIINHSQSIFGTKLSESLKKVAQEFFELLLCNLPLNRLEQLVKNNSRKSLIQDKISVWDTWLDKELRGIKKLEHHHVRELLRSLCQYRTETLRSDLSSDENMECSVTETLKSLATPPLCQSGNASDLVESCMTDLGLGDNNGNSSIQSSLGFCSSVVPSSLGDEESEIPDMNAFPNDMQMECNEYSFPNLQQFMKHPDVRGCIVKLYRL